MARHENNRYLGGIWVLAAAGVAFLVVQLLASAPTRGDGRSLLPFAGVGVGLLVALGVRLWGRRRIERAFRQPGPEALLRAMSPGNLTMIPNGAAWGAYFKAWAYTLYGQFDAARTALDHVEWTRQPPIVQAAAESIEVLHCFLDTRDFARGLSRARHARATADVSGNFPGAKTAMDAYDSLVEIGRVLTDQPKADTMANLEACARTLPFGARLIAMWGLAAAHARAGDAAQAQEILARCRTMAPHCELLCSLPDPGQAESTD